MRLFFSFWLVLMSACLMGATSVGGLCEEGHWPGVFGLREYLLGDADGEDDEDEARPHTGPVLTRYEFAVMKRAGQQRDLLQYFLRYCQSPCSGERLQRVYGRNDPPDKDRVLEDVVALISLGNNIRYDHTADTYEYFIGEWIATFKEGDGRKDFLELYQTDPDFISYSLAHQTYCLYARGVLDAQISTVALFNQVIAQKDGCAWWRVSMDKLSVLIALQRRFLTTKAIPAEGKPMEYLHKKENIDAQDFDYIRKSMQLFSQGRIVLTKTCWEVISQEEAKEVPKLLGSFFYNSAVLRGLRNHHGAQCSERYLKGLLPWLPNANYTNTLRQAIVDLRETRGLNILHDAEKKTFALMPGRRIAQGGPWRVALWKKLNSRDNRMRHWTDMALELSDEGYNPGFAHSVKLVRALKQFAINANSDEAERKHGANNAQAKENFRRRRALWLLTLAKGKVLTQTQYKSHPDIPWQVTPTEHKLLKGLWGLYDKHLRSFYAVAQDEEMVKKCLQESTQGVSIACLKDMIKETTGKDVVVWRLVLALMRRGYAHHIHYIDGLFFWREGVQKVVYKTKDVLNFCCEIAKTHSQYTQVALRLYKNGYVDLWPIQIKKILDMLCIAKRIPVVWENAITRAWDDVLARKSLVNSFPPAIANDVQELLDLMRCGFMQKVSDRADISTKDVERFCPAFDENSHDGLCEEEQKTLSRKRQKEAEPLVGEIPVKKPCMEAPQTPSERMLQEIGDDLDTVLQMGQYFGMPKERER